MNRIEAWEYFNPCWMRCRDCFWSPTGKKIFTCYFHSNWFTRLQRDMHRLWRKLR